MKFCQVGKSGQRPGANFEEGAQNDRAAATAVAGAFTTPAMAATGAEGLATAATATGFATAAAATGLATAFAVAVAVTTGLASDIGGGSGGGRSERSLPSSWTHLSAQLRHGGRTGCFR